MLIKKLFIWHNSWPTCLTEYRFPFDGHFSTLEIKPVFPTEVYHTRSQLKVARNKAKTPAINQHCPMGLQKVWKEVP